MKLIKTLALIATICLFTACEKEKEVHHTTEFIETYNSIVEVTCNDMGTYTYYDDVSHLIDIAEARNERACIVVDNDYVYLGVGPCIKCERIID